MLKPQNGPVMLFKLSSEKLIELGKFIDTDSKSLTILTLVQKMPGGAVFEERTGLLAPFGELEKAC